MPVVPYGSMPSSYRYDKARRAEWTQAVARGPRGAAADRELDEAQNHLHAQAGVTEVTAPNDEHNRRRRAGTGHAGRRRPAGAPAEYPPASPAGRGMFGIHGTGDTSGFGGLVRQRQPIDGRRPAVRRLLRRGRRRAGGGVPRPSTTRSRRSSSTAAS